jgi:hypothetical protein
MRPELDKNLIATVIVEALYTTDERACKKYGISTKSLQRYRKQLATDDELSSCVHTKKAALDNAWADELKFTLSKGIRILADCFEAVGSDPVYSKNPEIIKSIAGAIMCCADVELTGKMINARIAPEDRAAGEVPGQVLSGDDTTSKYAN